MNNFFKHGNTMDLTLKITTEEEYLLSRRAIQEKKHILETVDRHHAGAIKQYKDYKAARKPIENEIKTIRAAQKAYLTQKRLAAKSQAAKFEDEFISKRTKLLHEQAEMAEQRGNLDQATLFREIAADQQTTALTVEIEKQPDTMTNWGYEIVDTTKLNPGFATVTITPQRDKILKAVRKHHEQAESIVGVGSIRVYETVTPVYRKPGTDG